MNPHLNNEARDRLQCLITSRMEEIGGVCRSNIKAGLDYLEEARTSVYTEDMDVIESLLKLASNKFDIGFGVDSESIDNLAGVAREINQSEER